MDAHPLILIPAGSFWMGSDRHQPWESPRHQVFLEAFRIAQTSVTRREYAQFLLETLHEQPRGWNDPHFGEPNQPVVGVNWFDAVAYCDWLSSMSGTRFRLPSEAEWEKASRGGIEDADYFWGNTLPDQVDYYRSEWTGPKPVAAWKANGYGLFNMGDNVHEWCLDWYAADYYQTSPESNPRGPEEGIRRVSRGGSWRHQVKASRNAHRSSLPPAFRYTDYGFRLVCDG